MLVPQSLQLWKGLPSWLSITSFKHHHYMFFKVIVWNVWAKGLRQLKWLCVMYVIQIYMSMCVCVSVCLGMRESTISHILTQNACVQCWPLCKSFMFVNGRFLWWLWMSMWLYVRTWPRKDLIHHREYLGLKIWETSAFWIIQLYHLNWKYCLCFFFIGE